MSDAVEKVAKALYRHAWGTQAHWPPHKEAVHLSFIERAKIAIEALELAARDNATADAALDRAARAAHGEVFAANKSGKTITRSDGVNEWTPEGDYGKGRSDAADAILALKSTTQAQRDAMAKISSEEKKMELK